MFYIRTHDQRKRQRSIAHAPRAPARGHALAARVTRRVELGASGNSIHLDHLHTPQFAHDMAHAILGLLDLDAVVAEEPRRVVQSDPRAAPAQSHARRSADAAGAAFAAVGLAVHPQQVQVDGARTVGLGLLERSRPSSASIFMSSSSSTNGASSVLISMTALANASWRVS